MTPFNPENKQVLTFKDCLEPAMHITDRDDAKQYLQAYIQHIASHLDDDDDRDPKRIALINLGFYTTFHSMQTRRRVEKLFGAKHPIYGSAFAPVLPVQPQL